MAPVMIAGKSEKVSLSWWSMHDQYMQDMKGGGENFNIDFVTAIDYSSAILAKLRLKPSRRYRRIQHRA
jgi:hypothetical protein